MLIPFYIPARHKPPKWSPKEGKLLEFRPNKQAGPPDLLSHLRAMLEHKRS